METIIGLIICVYGLIICINFVIVDKCRLFDMKLHIGFTIAYLILSPFTITFSIGQAMLSWYQFIKDKKLIIDTLRAELEDTKYNSLSDADLYSITRVLSADLSYSELETFEDIFNSLESNGWITRSEDGTYHYKEQTGQDK